jgi:acetylornithine deacetylase/succinyl-diaminopimelate desuccinylase-like protein
MYGRFAEYLNFKFPKVSDYLGEVKITLSGIHAGVQHNVVPESCTFTLDVRVTDEYSNKEAFEIIQSQMKSTLTARSFRLNSSKLKWIIRLYKQDWKLEGQRMVHQLHQIRQSFLVHP